MAKTAKLKKKATTPHSRAARRAASPSLNLDKSLKTLPRPSSPTTSKPTPKPHVLAAQPTGIAKRNPKSKPLKRQQRLRQIKGMERAADVMEKLEVKMQKSVGREKRVRERRKAWDELNGEKTGTKINNAFSALENGGGGEWVSDEEMEAVEEASGEVEAIPDATQTNAVGEVKEVAVPESAPLPAATATEEEDEIL
ncbi:hypothetical protein AOQ84DRAFT_442390 [Glonium stellatum]|uniref:Ribosome biogenesis protein Alb1 n=1 Tax=Glonium stellatum TaxID=574774 RepID=A0A8E2ES43_9PEZI|nr:hypothetical protein AOQ84DRAFT_442390 [Glonium stellatum]